MNKYTFKSADKKTDIHCIDWPVDNPKGVLLLVHGMTEFIGRYNDFAKAANREGLYVTGHDHLGHGDSVQSKDDWGYFGHPEGNSYLLSDIDTHVELMREKFPGLPLVILGHSMGSFLTRQYTCTHSDKLNAVIIMGTGSQPAPLLAFAKFFSRFLSLLFGWRHRSKMIQLLAFGAYLKGIKNPRTKVDWLTKDENIIDIYLSDARCTFTFTLNGFYQMFKSIGLAGDKTLINQIRKDLPILLVSGEEDPVGGFGKGVKIVYDTLKSANIQNVKLKLYKNDRHEILNETDREVVYSDILNWISEVIKG